MGNWISEETLGFILGCSSLRSSGNLVGVAFGACLGVRDQIAGERQEARMAQLAPSRGPAVKDAREMGKEGRGLVLKGGDAGELINWERMAQALFLPTEDE